MPPPSPVLKPSPNMHPLLRARRLRIMAARPGLDPRIRTRALDIAGQLERIHSAMQTKETAASAE